MKTINHMFWGKVRKGKSRGKKLGFPTANIALHKKIPEGVYISQTKINNIWHPSLTFIGAAKTFGETQVQAETYLLYFNTVQYQSIITVKLLKKIRGNKKFHSPEALVAQMGMDKKAARTYFQKYPGV